MRPYERLTDYEFEGLIGDLLGREDDRLYERFRRGPDLGIDLRYIEGDDAHVIQCKHYRQSSFSKLKTAAGKEVERLKKLDPPPSTYRFVTSRDLTPGNKDELAKVLGDWVRGPRDILGGGDVDALLDKHDRVELHHVKLWLSGGTALAALLNADVYNRSRALLEQIDRVLPLYVQTAGFLRAHQKLGEERVCVVSGPPGIGKTTLAQMLVADAIKQGFEPIEVSRNIEEAWRVFDPEVPQIFYYDDFLGTTTLGELEKNEDQSLVSFIAAIATRPNALFVLTTREYIYKQAHALYESFERAGVDARKFLLTVDDYGLMDRAQILYNHVFHAENLPDEARRSLVDKGGYRQIVEHHLFNPRLIAAITAGYGSQQVEAGINFIEYAISALEDPELIWRRVYESQIDDRERTLLHALVTMPLPAQLGDLRKAYLSLAEERGLGAGEVAFEGALEILDDSLTNTDLVDGEHVAEFANPSIQDFVRKRLAASPQGVASAIAAASYFDQIWVLEKMLDLPELPDEWAAAMAARCIDLFESDSTIWTRSLSAGEEIRLKRTFRHLEGRLVSILELIGQRQGSEFNRLRAGAGELLERLRERWRQGVGDEYNALRLISALFEDGAALEPPDGVLEDVKYLIVSQAREPHDYRLLLGFRDAFPDLFTEEEMEEVAEQFRRRAEEDLAFHAEDIGSDEDLRSYGFIAEELGVALDSKLLREAARTIAKVARQEELRFERYEEERGEAYSGPVPEREEMDALFNRLLD